MTICDLICKTKYHVIVKTHKLRNNVRVMSYRTSIPALFNRKFLLHNRTNVKLHWCNKLVLVILHTTQIRQQIQLFMHSSRLSEWLVRTKHAV